jgi:hypothetical protein
MRSIDWGERLVGFWGWEDGKDERKGGREETEHDNPSTTTRARQPEHGDNPSTTTRTRQPNTTTEHDNPEQVCTNSNPFEACQSLSSSSSSSSAVCHFWLHCKVCCPVLPGELTNVEERLGKGFGSGKVGMDAG